ncbi:MAG: hypothetical protein E7635_02730 [Ruminococcaceae bacterium]|nr:hypothetical protein [Oscillospiraceae bacterium]
MLSSIQVWMNRLSKTKNIWLIISILVFGILLCLYDGMPTNNNHDSEYEKEIAELCKRVTGNKPYVSINGNTIEPIQGVVIIFDFNTSSNVCLKITEMLSALYSVPSSRIYITGQIK